MLINFLQTVDERGQRRKKRRACASYLVCQCSACLNARLPRLEISLVLIHIYRNKSSLRFSASFLLYIGCRQEWLLLYCVLNDRSFSSSCF